MDRRIVIIFAVIATASCKDIILSGANSATDHKIYDETLEASPAIWKQIQNVTVNTTENEVISRIVITDLREDKAGEANIVDGGEGNKTVTIELKSPTVLRGYQFHIEIYATPEEPKGPVPFDPTAVSKDKISNKPFSNEGKLRFNIGEDMAAPKTFGEEQVKQPTPLSTEVNANDRKRQTRDTTKSSDNFNIKFPESPVEVKGTQKPRLNHKFDDKLEPEPFEKTRTNEHIQKIPADGHIDPSIKTLSGLNPVSADSDKKNQDDIGNGSQISFNPKDIHTSAPHSSEAPIATPFQGNFDQKNQDLQGFGSKLRTTTPKDLHTSATHSPKIPIAVPYQAKDASSTTTKTGLKNNASSTTPKLDSKSENSSEENEMKAVSHGEEDVFMPGKI